jgi:hypothetical protein
MSVTFIVILLLVIGIVFANIALLRHGSKPMPVINKSTTTTDTSTAAAEKAQAAIVSAVPLTVAAPAAASNNSSESGKSSTGEPNFSSHNASGPDDSVSGGD